MAGTRVLIVDEDEAVLVVDGELVRKVDERRGDMSRPEFLNLLIDNQLQPGSEAPIDNEYVSKEEFLQSIQRIRDLLRNFLEFFLSYGLDLVKLPQSENLQELSNKLEEITGPEKTPVEEL